jgi:hypothetical protein
MEHLTEKILSRWREVVDDLRVCHDYYCRYNCGTLVAPYEHTPRCKKMQEEHGFKPWPRAEETTQKR